MSSRKTKGQRKAEDRRIMRKREKSKSGDHKQDVMIGKAVRRKWGGGVAK